MTATYVHDDRKSITELPNDTQNDVQNHSAKEPRLLDRSVKHAWESRDRLAHDLDNGFFVDGFGVAGMWVGWHLLRRAAGAGCS